MPQTYNEKLEISILHCLFKDGSLFPVIEDIIEKKSFGWPSFGIIFQSIKDIISSDLYPDPMSIYVDLDRKGKLDEIRIMSNGLSGKEALDFIENFQEADTNNIESYAYQLQKMQAVRQLISCNEKFGQLINDLKEPAEILNWLDSETGKIAVYLGIKSQSIKDAKDVAKESVDQLEDTLNGNTRYILTGIKAWDDFVGGLCPKRLYVVSAVSGDGKSALAENIIKNISIDGVSYNGVVKKVKSMIFSFEMPATEVHNRFIQMFTGISHLRIDKGDIRQNEKELFKNATKTISESNVLYDDSSELILPLLRTKMRKAVADGVKVIVLDQLEQILVGGTGDSQQESIRLNHIAYRIKAFAKELDIPVILIHQMNRAIDTGQNRGKEVEPQMHDLNQAGEKPADAVLMIRHKRENKKIVKSIFWWVKVRQGEQGNRRVEFDGSHMTFKDIPGLSAFDEPEFVQDEFLNG